MADLGLERGLPTCKASLLAAPHSPGGEGVAILLGPQVLEDVDYESAHRMFLEDPRDL